MVDMFLDRMEKKSLNEPFEIFCSGWFPGDTYGLKVLASIAQTLQKLELISNLYIAFSVWKMASSVNQALDLFLASLSSLHQSNQQFQ